MTNIFVNLPVQDLKKSKAFFSALGFSFNAQFTNDEAACMVVSALGYVMLLTHDKFRTFTPNPIADARTSTEVLVCLSAESREQVTAMIDKALAGGGTTFKAPQDYGFMYGHSFQDLDGHIWEIIYMDPAFVQKT